MNITFGTIKKAGRDASSNEKYPNQAVITIEGFKGEGKSRRILFNNKSMDLLKLPSGENQHVIFAFIEGDENFNRRLLIANAEGFQGKEDTVVYQVSKNKVAFENSKEKGKGISSSPLHKEITDFLNIDENVDNEFQVVLFGENSGVYLHELVPYGSVKEVTGVNISSGNQDNNIDPKTLLTFNNQEDLLDASSDNEIEVEHGTEGIVTQRDIEEIDQDIKTQNANIDPKDIEEEFVSNTNETNEDWE